MATKMTSSFHLQHISVSRRSSSVSLTSSCPWSTSYRRTMHTASKTEVRQISTFSTARCSPTWSSSRVLSKGFNSSLAGVQVHVFRTAPLKCTLDQLFAAYYGCTFHDGVDALEKVCANLFERARIAHVLHCTIYLARSKKRASCGCRRAKATSASCWVAVHRKGNC